MSTGFKVSTPAIIAVLICFFLPWLTVSCGGMEISLSGYDLAAGVSTGYGERSEGDPVFWLILVGAIACLALAGLIYLKIMPRLLATFLQVILATIGLAIIILKWSGYRSEPGGMLIEPRFGLWGSIIALAGVIVGGVIDLLSSGRSTPSQIQAPPPGQG